MNATVQEINHVTLKLQLAGTSQPAGCDENNVISFVYGIGVDGLHPLETSIIGKKTGEFVEVDIPCREGGLFFGHLMPAIRSWWDSLPQGGGVNTIRITVQDIKPAQNHEIVKAMANTGGHCGGGSCGCGCS
jgi:hypothetical protein